MSSCQTNFPTPQACSGEAFRMANISEMGYLRKMFSVGSTFATGVPVVQFRSDTERAAHQTKLLRQDLAKNSYSGPPVVMHYTAPSLQGASNTTPKRPSDIGPKRLNSLENLKRLHALLEQGIITEAEFATAKSEIMKDL
jgi:hypothetical protein